MPQFDLKNFYVETYDDAQVAKGLSDGSLIRDTLRVSDRNSWEAYVRAKDNGGDILVFTIPARNRALHGDTVVVELLPPETQLRVLTNLYDLWFTHKLTTQHQAVLLEAQEAVRKADLTEDDLNNFAKAVDGIHRGGSVLFLDKLYSLKSKHILLKQLRLRAATCVLLGGDVAKVIAHDKLKQRLPNQRCAGHPREVLQRCGVVRAVLSQQHPRQFVATVKAQGAGQGGQLVARPLDKRLPDVHMRRERFAAQLDSLDGPLDDQLFVVQLVDWPSPDAAVGHLVRHLGSRQCLLACYDALLVDYAIDSRPHPPHLLHSELVGLSDDWQVPSEELERRTDRRHEIVFTIDPPTASDLDDALHVRHLPNTESVEVGVHIADVSYFVEAGSHLDCLAERRATTYYMQRNVYTMLPKELTSSVCSLLPMRDRLAVSVLMTVAPNGAVSDVRFQRSVIRSRCRLTYDQAQEMLDAPTFGTYQESNATADEAVFDSVRQLQKLAVVLSASRNAANANSCALRIDKPKLAFRSDAASSTPAEVALYEGHESNDLVAEFMILANRLVAERLCEAYPQLAFVRRQLAPSRSQLLDLHLRLAARGFDVADASNASLQQALRRLAPSHPAPPPHSAAASRHSPSAPLPSPSAQPSHAALPDTRACDVSTPNAAPDSGLLRVQCSPNASGSQINASVDCWTLQSDVYDADCASEAAACADDAACSTPPDALAVEAVGSAADPDLTHNAAPKTAPHPLVSDSSSSAPSVRSTGTVPPDAPAHHPSPLHLIPDRCCLLHESFKAITLADDPAHNPSSPDLITHVRNLVECSLEETTLDDSAIHDLSSHEVACDRRPLVAQCSRTECTCENNPASDPSSPDVTPAPCYLDVGSSEETSKDNPPYNSSSADLTADQCCPNGDYPLEEATLRDKPSDDVSPTDVTPDSGVGSMEDSSEDAEQPESGCDILAQAGGSDNGVSAAAVRYAVFVQTVIKSMQLAEYRCAGVDQPDADRAYSPRKHYQLNIDFYTHFTSPIRRYADIVVHRLLLSAIGLQPPAANFNVASLQSVAERCNNCKVNSRKASEDLQDLLLAAYVRERGSMEEHAVIYHRLSRRYDLLVIRLGLIVGVQLEKLPLEQLALLRAVPDFTPIRCQLVNSPSDWTELTANVLL